MTQFDPYAREYERPWGAAAERSVVATFMNAVYAWMCVGLATTAVVAWWVSTQPQLMQRIYGSGMYLLLFLATLGLVVAITYAINRISAAMATGLFLLYSALMGLLLSGIFVVYALGTIGAVFLITSTMFGVMSLIGFVTKKDLTGMGSFLFMALIGLIIASVVNIFLASPALMWIISYAGVAIFLGLTAYDTQKLKQIAYATHGNQAAAARMAIVGSLILYLDFINLFLFLLRIFGSRRE